MRVGKLPQRLGQLRWSTWRGVLARAAKGFIKDNCADWAAALTYYSVLALFPAMVVIVALAGLVADTPDAVNALLGVGRDLVPPDIMAQLQGPIEQVATERGPTKFLLSVGLLGAIWSASGFVGAFTRASNAIYGVQEGRRWLVLRPLQLLMTAASLVLLAIIAVGLVVSGPVTRAIGRALRLGDAPQTAWNVGKWPVLVLVAMVLLSLLFWIAPNVRQPRFRWLTVGGAVALVAAAVASVGFGLYVGNFASYDVVYGSLGAVIAFLVWLYLVNCAVMLGVEINAELARGRAMQAGRDADEGPALPPREPAESPESAESTEPTEPVRASRGRSRT